ADRRGHRAATLAPNGVRSRRRCGPTRSLLSPHDRRRVPVCVAPGTRVELPLRSPALPPRAEQSPVPPDWRVETVTDTPRVAVLGVDEYVLLHPSDDAGDEQHGRALCPLPDMAKPPCDDGVLVIPPRMVGHAED